MTSARDNHPNNIVIGAGEIFIDELDSSGNPTGERYLGDTTSATLNVQEEVATIFSGDGPKPQMLAEAVTSRSHQMTVVMHDMSIDNLALLIGGEVDTQSDTATAVVDEVIESAKQGRWYQLGTSKANPAGIGAIATTGLVVTNDGGTTTYVLDTDYQADPDHGRIYIMDSGSIDDSKLKVDYTPVAASYERVKSADDLDLEYACRYIEYAASGTGRNVFFLRAKITVSGETALKGDRSTEQQATITISSLRPDGGMPAVTINGKSV